MLTKIRSAGVLTALFLIAVSSAQLGGDINLWLHDGNNNLRSTSMNILVDQEIANGKGMYIQLNCISTKASPLSFQQFIFLVDPTHPKNLVGQAALWSGQNSDLQINAGVTIIDDLPIPATIPAGSSLIIQLNNDDNDIITSVDFSVTRSNSKPSVLGTGTIDLTQQNLTSGSLATLSNLSPIFACTVNIIGFGNDTESEFSSGSGTISYSSENQLKTSNKTPPGSVFNDFLAAETSNVEYGEKIVQKGHSSVYTQTFNVPSS
jgi:hypothetical protein